MLLHTPLCSTSAPKQTPISNAAHSSRHLHLRHFQRPPNHFWGFNPRLWASALLLSIPTFIPLFTINLWCRFVRIKREWWIIYGWVWKHWIQHIHTHTHTYAAENTHAQINNKSHGTKREEEALSEAFIVRWDGKYKIWTHTHTHTHRPSHIHLFHSLLSYLPMIYKAFTPTEKERTERLMSEERELLCVEHKRQSGSALIQQWAKMHSPFFFFLISASPFFFLCTKTHTLDAALIPLQARLRNFNYLCDWVTTHDSLQQITHEGNTGGRRRKKNCLGVWRLKRMANSTQRQQHLLAPEANLDTLLVWCKTGI